MAEFPIAPDEVTAEWLGNVLGEAVAEVSTQAIGAGLVGDSARINFTAGGQRRSLAAKFPAADPTSRQTAISLGIYEKEVGFYRDVAPHIATRVPQTHFAQFEASTGDFLLLMEDLGPCRQGDQIAGCTFEDALHCMREIAKLHAPTYGNEALLGLGWLKPNDAIRAFAGNLYPGATERFCEFYADRMSQRDLNICAQLGARSDRLFGEAAPTGPAIIHGDFRLDNILFDIIGGDEAMATLDWQTVALGDPMIDVGYFMGAGIGEKLRKQHEAELLAAYHAELSAQGGPEIDEDDIRRGYARGAIHGISTAVFSWAHVQVTDRSANVFQSMAEGACSLAHDLDALATLD